MSYCAGLGQTTTQPQVTEVQLKSHPPVVGFGIPPFWISFPVTETNVTSILVSMAAIGTLFFIGKKLFFK